MDLSLILEHLGGGLNAVVIVGLGWAVKSLWYRVYELHDNALKRESEHAKELVETIRTIDAAIRAVEDRGK